MSQVNFLPATFVNQAKARRRQYRHMVMLGLFAVLLVGWGFAERGRNVRPAMRAADLESQVQAARDQMSEFVKLRNERDALVQQDRIKNELVQPILHTQVIAALDRHMHESIGLTSLQIKTLRPPPKAIETARGGKSRAKKTEKETRAADQLELEIEAIAPDDMQIANLIGALSEDPLFDLVTLKYSKTAQVREMEGRQFRMSMRVRLDRRFEEEEARHAD